MLNEKRGQVTAFIIIGIILVLVIGTTFYIINKDKTIRRDLDISKEVEPVVNYIKDCIYDVAVNGISILGAQGGYINIPEDKSGVSLINPHPNALDVFDNGGLYVPYWFYESENGLQKEQLPTIQIMEDELEGYINRNSGDCLDNLSYFAGYNIGGFSDIETEVDIRDNKVIINVKSPTFIEYREVTQEVDKFGIVVETGLGEIYNKAKDIYDKQTEDMFLEKRTIDMMVLYDEIPFSGNDFDCDIKIWAVENVKNKLKDVVTQNVGATILKEANLDVEQEYFSLDVNKDNFDMNMMYSKSWPFFMEVFPSENGMMKGDNIVREEVGKFISTILCINDYHFVYDVAYPVLVNLRDTQGYNFQFAYMVVIDNNQEREDVLSKESIDLGPNICDYKSTRIEIGTYSFDNFGKIYDLGDVDVSFKCFSTTCPVGETNSAGSLTTLIPQCMNGLLTGDKQGYFGAKNFISSNVEISTYLILEKVYGVDYEIKIIDSKDGSIRELRDDEMVLLQLDYLDDDYMASGVYPDSTRLDLIAGDYNVEAHLIINGEGLKLEEQEIKKCVRVPKKGLLGLFMTEEKCVDVNIPESEVETLVSGGAKFEWEVLREDLASKDKVVLYVMESELPKTLEDVSQVYDLVEKYESNINFLYPVFMKNEI